MVSLVYMVAGMSSRFGGKPKQMAKIGPNNETLIEYSVNQAIKQDFTKLIFITNKNTQYLFENIFGDSYKGKQVLYIEQKYDRNVRIRPWGTTDAICCLLGKINEACIIVNGDDIYGEKSFKEGFDLLKTNNYNIMGGLKVIKTMPENGKVNRGIIDIDNYYVIGLKEELNISKNENPELMNKYGNVNFIGLQYDTIFLLNNILEEFKEKHKNESKLEILLPNNLNELIKKNLIKMKFFEIENNVFGLTNPEDEIIIKNKLK